MSNGVPAVWMSSTPGGVASGVVQESVSVTSGPVGGVPPPTGPAQRSARLTAETIALNDAVVMEGSIPTPQSTWSPTAHST